MSTDPFELHRQISGHQLPPGWLDAANTSALTARTPCMAKTLIVADGVADPLALSCLKAGYAVYVLHPASNSVVGASLARNVATGVTFVQLHNAPAGKLPQFDVLVTGCATYATHGYLHTTCQPIEKLYRWLCDSGVFTAQTTRYVIANRDQLLTAYRRHAACFTRADVRLDAVGYEEFTPPRRQRYRRRRSREPRRRGTIDDLQIDW